MFGSYWDESSSESESELSGFETKTAIGSEGMFIPSSSSNGSYDGVGDLDDKRRTRS